MYTHITGWGKYIPPTVLTNDDLATIVDTSDEWIVSHTGIKERHIAIGDETTCTMAAQAARDALAVAGLTPQDLDLIIVSASTPDRQLPGAAFVVQGLLGADNAAAFDLRSGCSGFLYSLSTASQFIRNGVYRRALVVGAEVVSRNLNWGDRRTCCLFGDGAGAVVLEASENPGGLLYTGLGAQGKDFEALTVKSGGSQYPMCPVTVERHWHTVELDGQRTASFAIRTLLRRSNEAVTNAGLTWDDIELFIPHQANVRLIEATSQKLGVPAERTFVNVDRYANMSTASLAVALAEAAEQGRIKPGDHVLLVAFGAGLAWATAIIQWGAAATQQQSGSRRPWRRARARLTTLALQARLALYDLSSRLRHKKK
ncbi:MAG: ketoacyl-ACP synthase III [Chloroflexi bacterium]|nr:ketoacyl-ACP synthase III [Chloroflexota bacterium]